MKNTCKILALVLVVMTVLMSLTIVAGAEESESTATTQTVTMTFESKDLDLVAANDYSDGDSVKAGTDDFFTIVYRASSKVEDSSATWGAAGDNNYYTSTRRLSLAAGTPKNRGYITFTTEHANATVKVWWVSNQKVNKIDKDGEELTNVASFGDNATKNEAYYNEVKLPEAGTYFLYASGGTNYIYKIEVSWEVESAPAHENKLVVGETTDIVIDDTLPPNSLGYYVSIVPFVVTEPGNYAFTSEDGIPLIYDADINNLCGYTGKANLEPGTYYVWISPKLAGETGTVHVTTTKSAWVYNLAVGENSVTIDAAHGAIPNDGGYPTTYAYFTASEAAHYKFAAENVTILIFDLTLTNMYGAWTGESDLEAGTYVICLAFNDKSEGTCNVTVTQTAITPPEGGEEGGETPDTPDTPTHDGEQVFVLGENKVVIDGCTTNGLTAVEMVKFVVTEKGVYKFTSDKLKTFISTSTVASDVASYVCGFTGTAELEPGTYYICCGNNDIRGEFTVTATKLEDAEAPHKNVMVVGNNKYIISDALAEAGFELFVPIEIKEAGTYVIYGGAPMKVYFWYVLGESSGENCGTNLDGMSETGLADYFKVEITEPGTYYMGFNYEYIGEQREFDIEISRHTECEEFENGKCVICGAEEPEQPSMFERIIATIMAFIQKVVAYVKRLFA